MTGVVLMHGHHNVLFSFYATEAEAEARRAHIPEIKPANEVPTRLRVMRALTDEEADRLPAVFLAAYAALAAARAALAAAYAEWDAAYAEWDAVRATAAPQLEALHREWCITECPWDGKVLVFPKEVTA